MDKILFFGYGAYQDRERVEMALKVSGFEGEDLKFKGGYGARLDGMLLAIQKLKQITPSDVQKVLERVWGENFLCYTLKPGNGQVAGVIWELTPKQFEVIKENEFIGTWREIVEAEAITTDQKHIKVLTEKAFDNAPISDIVDGLNYEANLNKDGRKTPDEYKDDEYRLNTLKKVREEILSLS